MTISADLGGKNYVLGKGRVFFDKFLADFVLSDTLQGEGERYIGNTPEFTTSSSSENLDHFDADTGLKVKDDSAQLSLDRTGKMLTDNVNGANIGLYFLGAAATVSQAADTDVVTLVTDALRGRFYQLGVDATHPSGLRDVENVVVKKGASWVTTVAASGNYQVDAASGRIYIEDDAVAINSDDLQITFDVEASTREQVISGSTAIYGGLRFISDNPKGTNRDYYFPYVKLSPDGDYALKGEEWLQIGFTFEILKKADNIEALYIDGRSTVTP